MGFAHGNSSSGGVAPEVNKAEIISTGRRVVGAQCSPSLEEKLTLCISDDRLLTYAAIEIR
jgi:hypothetical protein